jgi:HEPN domain-containing protein
MEQAEWDFKAADVLRTSGFHEWACYACQQAAEKAIKSARTLLATNVDTIKVHGLGTLFGHLPLLSPTTWDQGFLEGLQTLTTHNEGARYPGLRGNQPQKPPHDVYTSAQSEEAIVMAQRTIEYCKKLCSDLAEFWSKNSHAP